MCMNFDLIETLSLELSMQLSRVLQFTTYKTVCFSNSIERPPITFQPSFYQPSQLSSSTKSSSLNIFSWSISSCAAIISAESLSTPVASIAYECKFDRA